MTQNTGTRGVFKMSYLQNQMNELKFDKRLLEINLKSGTVTQEEYQRHISALADDEANATQLDLASEAEESKQAMNGDSHPADATGESTPAMPTNTDPFGSGF